MTKKALINHLSHYAYKHFSFSDEYAEMVVQFIKDAANKIPGTEFEPDGTEFIEITPKDLFEKCCYYAGVNAYIAKSKNRERHYVITRQIYCHLSKKIFGYKYSLKRIGSEIGDRDHTTVIHSLREAQNHIDANDKLFMEYYYRIVPNLKEEEILIAV